MWDYFFASWQRAGQSPASPNFKMLIMATWVRMLPVTLTASVEPLPSLTKKVRFYHELPAS